MMNLSKLAAHPLETENAEQVQSAHWFDQMTTGAGFVEGLQSKRMDLAEAQSALADPAIAKAFEEGLAKGREVAESAAAIKERAQRELRLRFGELDSAALEVLEGALAETVLALCDSVLADHAVDKDALLQRCKAAANRLGIAAKQCALHLHPDDKALLAADTAEQWRIVDDPDLPRGSVVFQGPDGEISDGPAEWRAAIALAIGALNIGQSNQ